MASYRTSLTVDSTELPLRRIFFTASRSRNSKGKPSSGVNWLLFASIDVQEQFTFTEWMFDETMQKDVIVTFYKTDEEGEGETKLKEWTYNGTFCVGMLEMFAGDASYQTTNLFFTGKEVTNGNATMEHEWDLE